MTENELYHFGILGMRWGIRRYQNADGSLTEAGMRRYNRQKAKNLEKARKAKAQKKKQAEQEAKQAAEAEKKKKLDEERAEEKRKADAERLERTKRHYAKSAKSLKAHMDLYTNDELDAAIARLNKGSKLSELDQIDLARAREYANTILSTANAAAAIGKAYAASKLLLHDMYNKSWFEMGNGGSGSKNSGGKSNKKEPSMDDVINAVFKVIPTDNKSK